MRRPFRIAVDGPAGAGKGTLARALAAHYGFACLDTGMLYRLFALKAAQMAGLRPEAGQEAQPVAAMMKMTQTQARAIAAAVQASLAQGKRETQAGLASPHMGEQASALAALPPVRAALLSLQRDFAARPPGNARGAVLDGRDIGTVVCPEAEVKFFLHASPEIRAKRRRVQLAQKGATAPPLAEIRRLQDARDARDEKRAHAPLRPSPEAILLNTGNLTIKEAFARAVGVVDAAL